MPVAAVESALAELQPYAVIAAEQALVRRDFAEAERLRGLIAATDPQAPALPRLGKGIAQGRSEAARELELAAQRAAEAAAVEQVKLAGVTRVAAPAPPTPAPITPAPTLPPTDVAVTPPPRESPPAPPVSAAVVAAPSAPTVPARRIAELIPIRAPQPSYPPAAQSRGIAGEVEVTFSIHADGSVGEVVVVHASPQGVFEGSVQAALRRWRFKPIAAAMRVSRVFKFAP
jgi:protein TonB